jgi:hypothetical protein
MDIDNQPYSDENNYVGSFIKRIPGQVSDKGIDKMIDSVSNSAFETFKALFTMQTILGYLFGATLVSVWGMINFLQLIAFFPLINIKFPSVAYSVFKRMAKIAMFDFLQTENWFPGLFQIPEDEYSERFADLDIGSMYFICVIGPLFIVMVLSLV